MGASEIVIFRSWTGKGDIFLAKKVPLSVYAFISRLLLVLRGALAGSSAIDSIRHSRIYNKSGEGGEEEGKGE